MTRDEENMLSRNLSNNQIQDILDDLGMIDDNGCCPYTAEEIFKAGVNYADSHPRKGLWDADKVCKWISERIGIDQKIEINSDGEPLADSYIAYCIARQNAADTMIKDLRKAMED